jgi:nicotinamidase-related amidase
MTSALLIIDIQDALCRSDEAAHDIDAVIGRINALGDAARSAHVPVVLVQHEEDGGPLAFGAEGWQLAPALDTAPQDHRLRKTTPDSFYQTGLNEWLQQHGVKDSWCVACRQSSASTPPRARRWRTATTWCWPRTRIRRPTAKR